MRATLAGAALTKYGTNAASRSRGAPVLKNLGRARFTSELHPPLCSERMDETPEQFSAGATAPDKRAREAL